MRSGFIDKLIERIRRVQPEEVQNYLVRLAQEKGFLERIFDALQEGVIVTDISTGKSNSLMHRPRNSSGLSRKRLLDGRWRKNFGVWTGRHSDQARVPSVAISRSFIRNTDSSISMSRRCT